MSEEAIIPDSEDSKGSFCTVSDKATKSDDTPAPIHLLDNRILDGLDLGEEQRIKAPSALDVL